MANDYPQVVDQSTLTGVFQSDQFLAIGIEGQKDDDGDAVVGTPEIITSADESSAAFGPTSTLHALVAFLLSRGVNFVTAVASKSESSPTLVERKAAWTTLEEDPTIRIRLTDSVTQADLAALALSCVWAEGIQNKQFCFAGVASGSSKSTIIALATAMGSKRGVAVGPGVYDLNGVLMNGSFGAALAASVVSQNPDITDSLNGMVIPATAGIEKATSGMPLFRLHAGAGTPVNDFQDLLTGGVSPFQQDPAGSGMAAFSHLRTTYTTDDTYDALMTVLIKDGVFLGIRDMLLAQKFLRQGNTVDNRSLAGKLVDKFMHDHSNWVEEVDLPSGGTGYGVTVTPSIDLKSFTVAFNGQVVRGTNVINIADTLTIPVA